MKCDQFEKRLHWLLDRRRRPEWDDHLISHSYMCADCRSRLEIQELLHDGLEMIETPSLPVDFSQRVVAQATPSHYRAPRLAIRLAIRQTKRHAKRRPRPMQLGAAALVVAATIFVALVTLRGAALFNTTEPRIAAQSNDAQPIDTPASQPDLSVSSLAAMGTEESSPAQIDTTPQYQQLLESWTQSISDISSERYDPPDEIPAALRPIASSLGAAWNAFRFSESDDRADQSSNPQSGSMSAPEKQA